MKIEKFEDILSWKKGKNMAVDIYRTFSNHKDFGFKDQIQRAAVSISNNIAEGFERQSNKEFKHFLYIAKGSCGEVRSMLNIALDLKYINSNEYKKYHDECFNISRLISGLIKSL